MERILAHPERRVPIKPEIRHLEPTVGQESPEAVQRVRAHV